MPDTPFFRLLHIPIDAKGDALAAAVQALNTGSETADTYLTEPAAFRQIPGSPFAYWASDAMRRLFTELPGVQTEGRRVCFGLSTKDDTQFLRLCWEVPPASLGRRWYSFAKGGAYSPFHHDLHLVIDWEDDGKRLKAFANKRTQELFGAPSWSRWINNWDFYFRSGLTWPRRTNGFSVRALAAKCIFADKGPVVFETSDNQSKLLTLLAVMNSRPFEALVRVQLARTELAQSYEVGLIQNTPVPDLSNPATAGRLSALAHEAHDLQRDRDRTDETTHAFGLPGLVQERSAGSPAAGSLAAISQALDHGEQARLARLKAIQEEIDGIVLRLYGLTMQDLRLTIDELRLEAGETPEPIVNRQSEIVNNLEIVNDDEDEAALPQDLFRRVADLLMWCVGVVFGRWDVRFALDLSLLPPLGGPFDPLPRFAPGSLIGDAGALLPSAVGRPSSVLVDDPTHPDDIVTRVREVLRLLWGERADAVEAEVCAVLGFSDLRAWFRDARQGFFSWHIKRYSKSRRKAPIYWLLQSERRNYGLWLYYHAMNDMSLYVAGRSYADAKVKLEATHLQELRQGLHSLEGRSRRQKEQAVERQQKLVDEVTAFRNTLDRIALMNLPPDFNDGVLISIAPLHPLVPWKEAETTWRALKKGEYAWSTMAQRFQVEG